jgi:hypothetical protein
MSGELKELGQLVSCIVIGTAASFTIVKIMHVPQSDYEWWAKYALATAGVMYVTGAVGRIRDALERKK